MSTVKAKKHLGQHFLTDKNIASKIVQALQPKGKYHAVLEVGPGMGVLSDILLKEPAFKTFLIDIDVESISYLETRYPNFKDQVIHGDFLQLDFNRFQSEHVGVIGNFPYNISSQILFKILEERHRVLEVVGMFQKEVANRCAASPGSKEYGILSVFLQAYYHVESILTVKPGAFNPPPKVRSGVIRLTRNHVTHLDCDEKLFRRVVKMAFNQRRKTLRNALSALIEKKPSEDNPFLGLRAERLSVQDFVRLTNFIASQ